MIENKLTHQELARILCPFLRLKPLSTILPTLQDVLGIPIDSRDAVLCQTKVLLTFEGYHVDIRDLRQTAPGAASIIMQFKAKQKWWHGLIRDQNRPIIEALQTICRGEIADLHFTRFEATPPGDPLLDDGQQHLIFLHDSRAFNQRWQAGYDVSPLLISPDAHHGNCFVEFQFNSAAYFRSGDATKLRDDWLAFAFSVSEGIDPDAKRLLGLT